MRPEMVPSPFNFQLLTVGTPFGALGFGLLCCFCCFFGGAGAGAGAGSESPPPPNPNKLMVDPLVEEIRRDKKAGQQDKH